MTIFQRRIQNRQKRCRCRITALGMAALFLLTACQANSDTATISQEGQLGTTAWLCSMEALQKVFPDAVQDGDRVSVQTTLDGHEAAATYLFTEQDGQQVLVGAELQFQDADQTWLEALLTQQLGEPVTTRETMNGSVSDLPEDQIYWHTGQSVADTLDDEALEALVADLAQASPPISGDAVAWYRYVLQWTFPCKFTIVSEGETMTLTADATGMLYLQ